MDQLSRLAAVGWRLVDLLKARRDAPPPNDPSTYHVTQPTYTYCRDNTAPSALLLQRDASYSTDEEAWAAAEETLGCDWEEGGAPGAHRYLVAKVPQPGQAEVLQARPLAPAVIPTVEGLHAAGVETGLPDPPHTVVGGAPLAAAVAEGGAGSKSAAPMQGERVGHSADSVWSQGPGCEHHHSAAANLIGGSGPGPPMVAARQGTNGEGRAAAGGGKGPGVNNASVRYWAGGSSGSSVESQAPHTHQEGSKHSPPLYLDTLQAARGGTLAAAASEGGAGGNSAAMVQGNGAERSSASVWSQGSGRKRRHSAAGDLPDDSGPGPPMAATHEGTDGKAGAAAGGEGGTEGGSEGTGYQGHCSSGSSVDWLASPPLTVQVRRSPPLYRNIPLAAGGKAPVGAAAARVAVDVVRGRSGALRQGTKVGRTTASARSQGSARKDRGRRRAWSGLKGRWRAWGGLKGRRYTTWKPPWPHGTARGTPVPRWRTRPPFHQWSPTSVRKGGTGAVTRGWRHKGHTMGPSNTDETGATPNHDRIWAAGLTTSHGCTCHEGPNGSVGPPTTHREE